MKLNAFEKIIRKVIREEIDYALRRELALLKEELSNNKPLIKEEIENKVVKEDFRSKIQQQLPNFNTGNNTLDSLLNETAVSPSNEEVFAANDPVNNFINKDYGPLMEAMNKNKNFRP
jgi:CRISPR/Cas system CMR subunit Cmr6 (Cas7 group RAMP superfamily)